MAIFCIDAGGTWIKLGVVEGGRILGRRTIAAYSENGLGPQLPRIAAVFRELWQGEVAGVGMGFPSIIEPVTQRIVIDSGKYSDAMGLDLQAWARDEFDAPFALENDARLAVIGEWKAGAGVGVDDIVMVTLGTNIGTGVIQEGKVMRGKHGQAGNLGGHSIVNVNGRQCLCGAIGCVEAEASTTVLPIIAAEDPDYFRSPLKDAAPLDYAAVFKEAENGDETAIRLRDRSIRTWTALALSLVQAYDPDLFILGGGIMASGEKVLGPIRESLERNNWSPWGKIKVAGTKLGDDAALIGCESLFA